MLLMIQCTLQLHMSGLTGRMRAHTGLHQLLTIHTGISQTSKWMPGGTGLLSKTGGTMAAIHAAMVPEDLHHLLPGEPVRHSSQAQGATQRHLSRAEAMRTQGGVADQMSLTTDQQGSPATQPDLHMRIGLLTQAGLHTQTDLHMQTGLHSLTDHRMPQTDLHMLTGPEHR